MRSSALFKSSELGAPSCLPAIRDVQVIDASNLRAVREFRSNIVLASRLVIVITGSAFAKDSAEVLKRFTKLKPLGSGSSAETLEECLEKRIDDLPLEVTALPHVEYRRPVLEPRVFAGAGSWTNSRTANRSRTVTPPRTK